MAFRPQQTERIKNTLSMIGIVLSIMGIVTFSLFILEESFQTIMFGTWAAQDAQDWATVKLGIESMKTVAVTMKIITWVFGWIQPFALVSYISYGGAADYYITALTSKCLAHAPELFIGEQVTLKFIPRSFQKLPDGRYKARSGKIQVTLPEIRDRGAYTVSGKLVWTKNGLLEVRNGT